MKELIKTKQIALYLDSAFLLGIKVRKSNSPSYRYENARQLQIYCGCIVICHNYTVAKKVNTYYYDR